MKPWKVELPSGTRWQIFWRDPDGKGHGKRFKTKKEAEDHLAKVTVAKKENRYSDIFDIKPETVTTFDQLADLYEERCQGQACWPTKKYSVSHLREYFGGWLLSAITHDEIERWRNKRKAQPARGGGIRAEASVDSDLAYLANMLTVAVRKGLLAASPLTKGEPLAFKPDNRRTRRLNPDEKARLDKALDTVSIDAPWLKPIVQVAVLTGMRKGEILGLRWEDIKGEFIYLEASRTKTKRARYVPINDDLAELLRGQRRAVELTSPYIFPNPKTGRPFTDNRQVWVRALRLAGIKDFTFHDLRHTAASDMVEGGIDLYTAGTILGHTNASTTQRYAHLAPGHLKAAVGVLKPLAKATAK